MDRYDEMTVKGGPIFVRLILSSSACEPDWSKQEETAYGEGL